MTVRTFDDTDSTRIWDLLNEIGSVVNAWPGDTGWQPITIADATNFGPYSDQAPEYRVRGGVLWLAGAFAGLTDGYVGSQSRYCASLPVDNALGTRTMRAICQGTGVNRWDLEVRPTSATSVDLYVCRYGPSSDSGTNTWLPIAGSAFLLA